MGGAQVRVGMGTPVQSGLGCLSCLPTTSTLARSVGCSPDPGATLLVDSTYIVEGLHCHPSYPPLASFLLSPVHSTSLQTSSIQSHVDDFLSTQNSIKMKAAVILSLVAAVMAGVIEERACAGNNCNRAVTGTREGLLPVSERSAACSSFLKATVTPDAVYVTPPLPTISGSSRPG
ncbi:hypothetical protein HJFPF1_04711 [Paramyrothecium foliicola]|nr:hypothetical protein HJFPF1_04711 [Paramyrothecium foliicola]